MFEDLGKGLGNLVRRLVTGTTLDKKSVEEILNDMRRILLESDVDTPLVEELLQRIRKRAFEQKVPAGLTLREHVIKVIYEELVRLLGEKPYGLVGRKRILFAGLFGSGKTTTIAKLARFLKKQGMRPALVGCDFHRPAALEQLAQLGKQINVPVFYEKDPYTSAKNGLERFRSFDTIMFDTAGRNALDKQLAGELKKLKEIIKPDEVILVLPADLGKVARVQSEEFHKLIGITGVIITKMDGTAKAGGALVATSITGAKVKFLGTGEKLEDFEVYDPERFVSRLLGLGDIRTLMEKAKEAELKPEKMEKIIEGKFSLQDFLEQIEAMGKMGSLSKILTMIPGMGGRVPSEMLDSQEEKMKSYKIIIHSMTKKEREDPSIVDANRIKRIARGSGRKESEVRDLLNQYEKMKKLIRSLGGKAGLERGQLKQLGKQYGFKF